MTPRKLLIAVISLVVALPTPQGFTDTSPPSAWQEFASTGADLSVISTEERRVLQVLTQDQAREYSNGKDPKELVIADGRSLQDFLDDRELETAGGLILKPIDPCVLFDQETYGHQTLKLLGKNRDYSSYGGAPEGCGIPGLRGEILRAPLARALLVSLHVTETSGDGAVKLWPKGGAREPVHDTLEFRAKDLSSAIVPTLVVRLCDEESPAPCAEGDLNLRVGGSSARVTLTVLGILQPARHASVKAVGTETSTDSRGDQNAKSSSAPYWEPGPNNDLSYSDGNVGIGTSTPAGSLHIQAGRVGAVVTQPSTIVGNSLYFDPDYPTLDLQRLSGTRGVNIAMGNNSGQFHLYGSNSAFRIHTPSGSPAMTVEPDRDLQIHAALKLTSVGEGLYFVGDSNYFGTDKDARIIRLIDWNGYSGVVDGGLVFEGYTPDDGIRRPIISLRGNGDVGIGSKNPQSRLVVTYDASIRGEKNTALTVDAETDGSSKYVLTLRAPDDAGNIGYLMRVRADGKAALGQEILNDEVQFQVRGDYSNSLGSHIMRISAKGSSNTLGFTVADSPRVPLIQGYRSSSTGKAHNIGINPYGGKVGIGTLEPTAELEVDGDIKISGSLLSDGDICIGNCE